MENTLKNKKIFFAQYWGQDVVIHPDQYPTSLEDVVEAIHINFLTNDYENTYLELKPLSSITDEDLRHIYNNYARKTYKTTIDSIKGIIINLKNFESRKWDYLSIEAWDYLRSKGYALPFHDLSINELIEYGWIKIKEDEAHNK